MALEAKLKDILIKGDIKLYMLNCSVQAVGATTHPGCKSCANSGELGRRQGTSISLLIGGM